MPWRQLARSVVVSGETLVINGHPFTVTKNGERECVRPMIDGKRQRLYLDQIGWLAGLLDDGGADPLSTTIHSNGDLAYPADPLENAELGAAEVPGLAYGVELAGLKDTLDAMKSKREQDEIAIANGVDPLEL